MTTTPANPTKTKRLVAELNEQLTPINRTYHTGMPLRTVISVVVGFDLNAEPIQKALYGDNGQMHVEIGQDIFLNLSWHRMEASGNYEIVAYASSQYDDYREPYTRTMTAKERQKAKNLMNNKLLVPVGKTYYKGKAQGFGAVEEALVAAGLDYYEFQDRTMSSEVLADEGRLMGVDVGNGIGLSVSWYRMGSGNYEIVAYVS
jgi:hypothetical protein